jgi:hypothetical protein
MKTRTMKLMSIVLGLAALVLAAWATSAQSDDVPSTGLKTSSISRLGVAAFEPVTTFTPTSTRSFWDLQSAAR